MARYNKLELTWFNKDRVLVWDKKNDNYIWVEPTDIKVAEARILKERKVIGEPNSEWSPQFKRWIRSANKIPKDEQNILIKGDNLIALKALEEDFAGKIKLIYIDPPFNTGSRINADGNEVGYDDGLEHSIWLSMMKNRIDILHKLLSDEGTIFVHIDNNEVGHLKVIMDEIFGRRNFLQIISVRKATTAGFKAINLCPTTVTEYILMYSKNRDVYKNRPLYVEVDYNEDYGKIIKNPEDEPEKWKLIPLDDEVLKQTPFKDWKEAKEKWGPMWKEIRKSLKASYALENKERVVSTKDLHKPSPKIKELMQKSRKVREKVFVLKREKYEDICIINGRCIAFYSSKFRKVNGEEKPAELLTNFWADISWYGIANEGNVIFKNSKKPEKLLRRIIELGSEEGDWVLDSFAGSGTTGAVAHKMGRKWIMIEMAKHAETHCLPRLKAVIEGKEQDKHSYSGGFRYCELGESLFKTDNGIVGVNYDNGDLVEAVCKIEGFKFIGREFLEKAKLHGVVNQKRYCHVTEEFVTQDLVDELAQELKEAESLAIYCMKKMSRLTLPQNIQVKKIPRDIIKKFKLGA